MTVPLRRARQPRAPRGAPRPLQYKQSSFLIYTYCNTKFPIVTLTKSRNVHNLSNACNIMYNVLFLTCLI